MPAMADWQSVLESPGPCGTTVTLSHRVPSVQNRPSPSFVLSGLDASAEYGPVILLPVPQWVSQD